MKSTSKSNTAQWLVHLWNWSPVVQQDDDAILLLNCHLGDKCQQNIQHYPPDRDFSHRQHYPPFEKLGLAWSSWFISGPLCFYYSTKVTIFFSVLLEVESTSVSCKKWLKKISNCNLFPKSCGFMIIYVKTTSSDQSTSSVKIIFVLVIVILGLQHHLSALKNEQGCDKFCGPPYPSVYIALCRYWFY